MTEDSNKRAKYVISIIKHKSYDELSDKLKNHLRQLANDIAFSIEPLELRDYIDTVDIARKILRDLKTRVDLLDSLLDYCIFLGVIKIIVPENE